MTFTKENYDIAKDILDKRRNRAIAVYEERIGTLSQKFNEIKTIELALRAHGKQLLSLTSEGKLDKDAVNRIKEENTALQKKEEEFLISHGYDKDYLKINYSCSKCSDTGYIGIDICECLKKELIKANFASSGISELMKDQTFENFSTEYYSDRQNADFILNKMKDFADNFSGKEDGSYLFIGGTGLGKTHLSSAVASAVIERGFSVIYDSAVNIVSAFEDIKFRNSNPERGNAMHCCDLLIIDDLGAEMQTQFSLQVIYSLINSRLSKKLSTIINTNLTQNELRDIYNERITSRLFGEYQPFLFKGTDIRRLKLTKK